VEGIPTPGPGDPLQSPENTAYHALKAAAVAVVRYVFPVIGKVLPAAKLGVSETVSSLALTTRTQRSTLLLNFVKSKSPQYSVPVESLF